MNNATLQSLISDKVKQISYSKVEYDNLASTSNDLRNWIKDQQVFDQSFLGGSYKRKTMVKGSSDIDVYFRYTGSGTSGAALTALKTYLTQKYPKAQTRRDRPSVTIEFKRIPINVTPYITDDKGNKKIPNKGLVTWDIIADDVLKDKVAELRRECSLLGDLIKILKYWNATHKKPLDNYRIEEIVYASRTQYLQKSKSDIAQWMLLFFKGNGQKESAAQWQALIDIDNTPTKQGLKTAFSRFIDNKPAAKPTAKSTSKPTTKSVTKSAPKSISKPTPTKNKR